MLNKGIVPFVLKINNYKDDVTLYLRYPCSGGQSIPVIDTPSTTQSILCQRSIDT